MFALITFPYGHVIDWKLRNFESMRFIILNMEGFRSCQGGIDGRIATEQRACFKDGVRGGRGAASGGGYARVNLMDDEGLGLDEGELERMPR